MSPQDEPGSSLQLPQPAQVYHYVQNPADPTGDSDSEHEDHDIYRGTPPTCVSPRTPSPAPTTSSSSSTSSASVFRGRLGAISTGVEHAISRWARAWLSSSSVSSLSSPTSYSSSVSHGKSQTIRRRKRRPRSVATTIHNARSEREIAARVRARQDLRTISRRFVFYAPKLVPATAKSHAAAERRAARIALVNQDPIFRTTDLEEVTARLNVVLRERAKAHRVRSDPLPSAPSPAPVPAPSSSPALRALSVPVQDYMLSNESAVARSTPTVPASSSTSRKEKEKEGKGKQKPPIIQASTALPPPKTATIQLEPQRVAKAWWLDVSSPSCEDMCQIGKLLGLHPLTLEDILTQDPREKLELFPKLGYYLLSFRAIESRKTQDRLRNMLSDDAVNADDEGIVGEVNMYLVVFREGICSFHFADIEEHVDRVRHRIMLLDESTNASSDWIAHGLLDSVVDSYFPYLEVIEREVSEVERHIFSAGERSGVVKNTASAIPDKLSLKSGGATVNEKVTSADLDEAREPSSLPHLSTTTSIKSFGSRLRFVSPSFSMIMRQAKRAVVELFNSVPRFKAVNTKAPGYHHPTHTVARMARVRRLVTSLARFLAVKSEVVAQVKKRLLTKGEWGLGTGMEDDLDIYVYMGDVQDHIITLQQSLAHYERMLSQSHPTFLSQLRFSVDRAKSDSDKAITFLTVVSLGVVCVQTLIGLFSMNAEVPHNDLAGTKFNGFAIVLAGSVVIVVIYSSVVHYWWIQAKRHRLSLKN